MHDELAVAVIPEKGVPSGFEGCHEIAVYLCLACAVRFVVFQVVIFAFDRLVPMIRAEIREGVGIVRFVLALVDIGAGKTRDERRVLASVGVLGLS